MKTLLTTLSLIAVLICKSQEPTLMRMDEKDTALMRLQIQMPIKITKNNLPLALIDTSTHVLVEVTTIGHQMTSHTSEFILMLQPNMDYKITFKKPGCVTKHIFISTKNVSTKYRYIIQTTVDLPSGNSNVACGKVLFNTQKSNFISNVTGIKIVNTKAQPHKF